MSTKRINHRGLTNIYILCKGVSFDQKTYIPSGDGGTLGLLNEKITQGTKTRLRKILTSMDVHLKAQQETISELAFGEEFIDEEFEFEFEALNIEISNVENIISKQDYTLAIDFLFESTIISG